MQTFPDTSTLIGALAPDNPVYCVYPAVYEQTTRRFLDGFPGRVLYAVKANNEPLVLKCLLDAGVTDFDCASLGEIELVRSLSQDATCYFMNPVRIPGAARSAQRDHRVRHFVIDHESGLQPLIEEIDAAQSVIFARMAVSHSASRVNLSAKFGAPPDEIPALLQQIAATGAEPALAFNVGSLVMSPDAYVHAFETARAVLEQLPFRVRLLDIGGGFPKAYPGFEAPPLEDFFDAIRRFEDLPLADDGELLSEPGRALSARGTSAVVRVLLRKNDRLYINDGMYGVFWELRFHEQDRFPARAFRGAAPLGGELRPFTIFGPTCDSGDMLPGAVELPESIAAGDFIEFGSIGAYSLSGRTDFNGFYSTSIVTIDGADARPPR